MSVGKFNCFLRSSIAFLLAIIVMVGGLLIGGCNDHRFTPVAEIEVYPDVIDYKVQRTDQVTEQILITNKSVSARLEIFEISVEDSDGGVLTENDLDIYDQSKVYKNLQSKKNSDGSDIVYTKYPMGIVSNVMCDDDTYCNCDPDLEGQTDSCKYALGDGEVFKEKMGYMFQCLLNPIEQSSSQKVCVGHYRFYNNAGKTSSAVWGGERDFECKETADCSSLGLEYFCLDSGKCGSDIKAKFAFEYGLEQLVATDNSIVDTDNAAVWKGMDGSELCELEGSTLNSDVKFYGLNRCDQIALKQKIQAIDDGNSDAGYKLYPERNANYKLMIASIGSLEVSYTDKIAFCDGKGSISPISAILVDPISETETCLDEDGSIKTDLLSVDLDNVKINQLPIRVIYTPAEDYDSAEVLTGKTFTMRIENSARSGAVDDPYARTVILTMPENRGGPPTPIIEIPEDYQNPEPLDMIHLEGRNSTSPFGNDRKPFQYWWEWAPDGRPQHAQDAVLISSAGNFDNPTSIMGKWTAEGYPKIYLPIAGVYKIRLKVKDSAGVVSGPTDDCPTCKEWDQEDIHVKPSQKLHVELLWDRGDDVDLDIFLVRYREDGAFAIPAPIKDKLVPIAAAMPACTTTDQCFDGAFECDTVAGFCLNHCDTDDDCTVVDRGWFCNDSNECQENELAIVECEADADCGAGASCNPVKVGLNTYKMICTHHNGLALNDTCSFINKGPRWGNYDAVALACVDESDCNGAGFDEFTCGGTDDGCDFGCDSSTQCLTFSEQFLCSEESVCVGNNLDDDPTLDIDDVNGWGPENISLVEPDSGRYRVIARLYADPTDVVSDKSPKSFVKAYVQIYLNGELALSKGIGHEMADVNTYWKVADIVWDQNGGTQGGDINSEGDGYVEPICAGWTLTNCANSDECHNWFSDEYSCEVREWGKYCSSCVNASGTPDECNPTIPCSSNADCSGQSSAATCATIVGNYCGCSGANEFGLFETDPYANPFITSGGAIFGPHETLKRSIWCDSAAAKVMSIPGEGDINILSSGEACSSLY